MKILNFVFALLFFLFNSTAISQKIDIKGKILDKDNLKGIEDVNVLSVVSNSGTTSDKNGYFNLSLPKKLDDTIVFTHINYQKEIFVVPKDISDTIVIYLKKIVTNLNEVTVTASRSIFEDENYNILDFSFVAKKFIIAKRRL